MTTHKQYYRPHNTYTPRKILAYKCKLCGKKFEELQQLRDHKKVKHKELETMTIYQLSDTGRNVTWQQWKKLKGCGLPNSTTAYQKLGIERLWPTTLTLGDIDNACPFTGRTLARFAIEHLNQTTWVTEYITSTSQPQ